MKSISMKEAQSDIEAVLTSAQKERIVVTRAGKPCVVIVGIEGYDAEDLNLASSSEFWQMIEERRQGRSIPLAELRARLEGNAKPRKSTPPRRPQRRERTRPATSKE